MGAIWFPRHDLIGFSAEIIGYKSGLALTRQELDGLVPAHFQSVWFGDDSQLLRVRAEEIEALIAHFLFKVGNIESPSIAPPGIQLFHKYKTDKRSFEALTAILEQFPEFMESAMAEAEKRKSKAIDPTPFILMAERKHGRIGAEIAIELMRSVNRSTHISPWASMRLVEWTDTTALHDLFESESLATKYGAFIDQRYIDFLSHNFENIDRMNWRKFEGLTCEFFEKQGFHVEIGPGRNDDGIDARIWPSSEQTDLPPTILVQCKRSKELVSKTVVKALYADVLDENAQSGLIVTSQSLSPGAKKTCMARAYPVYEADRNTLRKWVMALRTPYSGVFLAR